MNYQETLQYLYDRLPVFHFVGAEAYKPGLEKSLDMMERLGNPQNGYKTIHVGGTNGKGSVSHMLAAVLQEAGYRVGLYTSPHLVDFGERIRVNGEMVKHEFVVSFVNKHMEMLEELQPSFFEATMALAFDYFAAENVDVAIIEVGLGGRLDSTNIIQPELSIITNVSFDHTQFLGNTLHEIAFEKAGIIKEHTPVVIGETDADLADVFLDKASAEGAPITFVNSNDNVEFIDYRKDVMRVKSRLFGKLECELTGQYQLKNLATLLESIERLQHVGFGISDEAIHSGVKNVVKLTGLMGRWQRLPGKPPVILDSGHNAAALENIVRQFSFENYNTLRIVIGVANDKDFMQMLEMLPRDAVYYFTSAGSSRSQKPQVLQQQAAEFDIRGEVIASVADAVEQARTDSANDDLIFIGGSNFVVGEALEYLMD